MLPPFDPITGYLPPGPHVASWIEIVERFGWNERRRVLLDGLALALRDLHEAGGRTFYLNGSFVTAKDVPGDFDLAYLVFEVDRTALSERYPQWFAATTESAAARRAHYLGDILPHNPDDYLNWVDYFSTDRRGLKKGYVLLSFTEDSLP